MKDGGVCGLFVCGVDACADLVDFAAQVLVLCQFLVLGVFSGEEVKGKWKENLCKKRFAYLAETNDWLQHRLSLEHKPLRQTIKNRKHNRKMQRKLPSRIYSNQRLMQRILKIRRVKLVIALGKRILGNNIGGQRHPRTLNGHDTIALTVLAQLRNQLVCPRTDHGLKVFDALHGEHGADGLAPEPVQLVRHRAEAVRRIPEPAGKVRVLVAPTCSRVQLIEEIGI